MDARPVMHPLRRRPDFCGVLALLLLVECGARPPRSAPPASPLGGPVVEAGTLHGERLLFETAAKASASGAGPMSVVASGETAERERLGAFLDVPDGACLLAYARGASSVEDLDLAVFSDEGAALAVDDAPDPHPTLLLCPPHPRRVYVAAVAASGQGLVAVGAQLVAAPRALDVGKTLEARGMPNPTARAVEAWPGLLDRIRDHEERLGGKWAVFRKVAVAVDSRLVTSVELPIEADRCVDALIVPDDDLGSLDVEAVDDHGRSLGLGAADERSRVLTVCSPLATQGSLELRPHVGQGLVAVVLAYSVGDVARDLSVRPALVWVAADAPLDRVRTLRETALRGAGYVVPSGTDTGVLSVGPTRSVALDLGPHKNGGCSRIDIVGGAPLALVEARVWDATGHQLTRAEGSSSVTLFACRGGKVRLDLEAHARPGPYAVSFRPEPWNDPAFDAHPIAAARMMERTLRAAAAAFDGVAMGVRAFHAGAGEEVGWDEVVPRGTCVRAVTGAEGGGAGLIGRVVDTGTGEEIDRAHAATAVVVRACAPEGRTRAVHFSVEVTGGRLDLIVGERSGS